MVERLVLAIDARHQASRSQVSEPILATSLLLNGKSPGKTIRDRPSPVSEVICHVQRLHSAYPKPTASQELDLAFHPAFPQRSDLLWA